MQDYIKKFKKIIVLLCISIIAGGVIMGGYAGIHYIKAGDNKGKHSIDNSEIEIRGNIKEKNGKYIVSEKGGKIIIKMPKQYVNKFTYEYESSFFSNSLLHVKKDNIYGVKKNKEIKDEYMQDMPRSVVNIDGKTSSIELEFNDSHNKLKVFNFGIDNSLKLNPMLGGFVSCLTFVFLFLFVFRKENKKYPAVAFFVCSFIAATCLLVLQPPYITGWDEQIHFKNAYLIGCTKEKEPATQALDYYYGNAYMINETTRDNTESVEEKIDYIRVLNTKNHYSGIVADDYTFQINSVGYIFQALFLKIGKIFNMPFYIMWLLGRFSNVLLYSLIMSLAIWVVPIAKRLLCVLGMMPFMIYQSTVYTYDITVIAFLILGMCILVREFIRKEEKFQYRWRVAFILCMVLGCLPKAVYFPMILSCMILRKEKFYSKKDAWIFKGIIVVVCFVLLASFLLPVLSSPEQSSDTRGGDTNGASQLSYILKQPFAYAVVLGKNVIDTLQDSFMGPKALNSFAYLGDGKYSALCAAFLTGVALTDTYGDKQTKKKTLDISTRIAFLIVFIVTIVFIWTALYISFTEVAEEIIQGVQARYYLPFSFFVYLCIQNKNLKNTISLEKYQLCIMTISNAILFREIGQIVLVNKCL